MMTSPDPDYPAAHSMDTEWFAVDADGHVGYFSSGEGGAVPNPATPIPVDITGDDLYALYVRLTRSECN